jgi:NADPH:quinone reductase
MRAIAVNEYGAMPALMEVPDPQPGPGQVLIKVEAAGINPFDRMIADGALQPIGPARFPLVLGVDLAGIVEAVGEGAGRFAPGEEVFGQLLVAPWGSAGTYTERVAVSEDQPLARVPPGLDPVVAAALPTAGSAALEIVESLEPLSGKTAVLVGAAGGVGSFATQLAANAGAHGGIGTGRPTAGAPGRHRRPHRSGERRRRFCRARVSRSHRRHGTEDTVPVRRRHRIARLPRSHRSEL